MLQAREAYRLHVKPSRPASTSRSREPLWCEAFYKSQKFKEERSYQTQLAVSLLCSLTSFCHYRSFAHAPLIHRTKTNYHHRRQISDRTIAQHSGNRNSNSKNSLMIYSQEPHPIESPTMTFQSPAISSYIHQPQQLQENRWIEPGPVFTPPHVIEKPKKLRSVHPTLPCL